MGQYTARAIRGDLAGRPRRPFSYWDKGQLAVIGRGHAVADIWHLHFGGLLAWLIWIFVHIFFLIGFRNRVMVLLEWGFSYLTYQRGARLITWSWSPGKLSEGRLKLMSSTGEHRLPAATSTSSGS
jgi:NADH dehydrogenase